MNCFPGVCFTKQSAVHFKTNFHGPFVFDVKSIPNYRNDTTNYFDTLPNEVIAMLFQYTAKFPLHVFAQLQLVSCRYLIKYIIF
jgi:regulatory protein YycH of two-component signal transduction system YycFG